MNLPAEIYLMTVTLWVPTVSGVPGGSLALGGVIEGLEAIILSYSKLRRCKQVVALL